MKLNADKFHPIVSGYKHEHVCVKVGTEKIWEKRDVKLLQINIDNELKCDIHVLEICSKAGRKLSALDRMSKLTSFRKRRTLFKTFIESQFKYCPFIWMFHNRSTNNTVNLLWA